MGTIVSKVPELLERNGWTPIDLIRRGLAINTSYRLARGETGITLETACRLVDVFGLGKLDDVFEYKKQQDGD